MATCMQLFCCLKSLLYISLHICIYGLCHLYRSNAIDSEYVFAPRDINNIVDYSCFVAFLNDRKSTLQVVFNEVESVFAEEDSVIIGLTSFQTSDSHTKYRSVNSDSGTDEPGDHSVTVFYKRKKDRSCLSVASIRTPDLKFSVYNGNLNTENIIHFINKECGTYRNSKGYLTVEGLHLEEILNTLFHVHQISNTTIQKLIESSHSSSTSYCTKESCGDNPIINLDNQLNFNLQNLWISKTDDIPKCEKVPFPSREEFFHSFLKISKPVILTGAMENWAAREKWKNEFLRYHYGESLIHVKLTPSGEYEGIDSADQFENYRTFAIPTDVRQQLLFPDLVVVRPATANMNLSEFLDIIEKVSNGTISDFSAYLEYSSLADIVPELENDIEEMPFFKSMLELKHKNIWLSDGNTLGKTHFDPFDNFLCQISGRKEVILFEPHDNAKFYEAHIPEAMLDYDQETKQFSKKTLVDSTSMVMSPVDIRKPDLQRFPLFADARPLNCTIGEGEVLFMPAFWWHEVQSYPNIQQGRNLAVNFWYDPFLVKEFPCQECKLDVNPKYRHLL